MVDVKTQLQHAKAPFGAKPFIPAKAEPNHVDSAEPTGQSAGPEPVDVNGPMKLSLPLGQLGNERRDRSIYDEKMWGQADYRSDGAKGGSAWKSRVERYFIPKIPVARENLTRSRLLYPPDAPDHRA